MAWLLRRDRSETTGYGIEAREQKCGPNGHWTKGKPLSPKKVLELLDTAPYFLPQDRAVAKHIQLDRYTGGHRLGERGWLALVGHPHVCWEEAPGIKVELSAASPELLIKKKVDDQAVITLAPPFREEQKVAVEQESPIRLKIIELSPDHHRIAQILRKGLSVPLAAQERVLASLSAIASLVTIHSDIGAKDSGEEVGADPTPRIHLLPEGVGLRVELLVRPFKDKGPYYSAGLGGARLIAEVDGKALHASRDLAQERGLADKAVALCPSLTPESAIEHQRYGWILDDPEDCLKLVLELKDVGDNARVEWPQGEKFTIAGRASLNQFSLRVRRQRDWFSLDGTLRLDNDRVLDMQRLLALMDASAGDFIQLDDGRFLALTAEFRKRLDAIRAYSEQHGDARRVPVMALPLLDELSQDLGAFRGDRAWQAQRERLQRAQELQPALPSTLQAQLRDYQVEGFQWLARLAAWGAGACLADDMGLGKTLQALAVILIRAPEGPSLVVAPTSVCMNWLSETARFAPTLKTRFLGSGDRQKVLDDLQGMDLVICSYALLQQEATGERLAQVHWQTIVLDEAQAIKNMASKRSQGAMALQGGFKLITTGTPIENHLGELWNLFRFINPGLLGSLESFNRRFAMPIERDNNRDARQQLKRLIQPFVLRRTKTQVLAELPERTEIQLQVDLSEAETALYEALRRRAVEELTNSTAKDGEKHLKILAALTKLRRACCHSALVSKDVSWPSSKLNLFGEVLSELLDNGHKVLVFSQFVDYLEIIRAYLDEKKVSYQYLDGQTPALERKRRVDAFQAGVGDVFLISLKAGGTGLNLTAADYVIHMDPWWNPAVEDQASDRAHRIGQQRPVTIYRLVTQGTIEEKIVAMHRQKRDLADSVLEGSEMAAKLRADDLLRLIAET